MLFSKTAATKTTTTLLALALAHAIAIVSARQPIKFGVYLGNNAVGGESIKDAAPWDTDDYMSKLNGGGDGPLRPAVLSEYKDIKDKKAGTDMLDFINKHHDGSPNAWYQMTLEPKLGLKGLDEEIFQSVADACLEVNNRGVTVLLRFGHEMNGAIGPGAALYYAWQGNPALYKEKFKQFANIIHASNEKVTGGGQCLMMFAPLNPYPGFHQLIDGKKVYYTDYYPDWTADSEDEEYVDWVGLTMMGPPSEVLTKMLNITEFSTQIGKRLSTKLETDDISFYERYCTGPNAKPFAIAETGIPWDHKDDSQETAYKVSWFKQLFGVPDDADAQHELEAYNMLQLAVWFDTDKFGYSRDRNYGFMNRPAAGEILKTMTDPTKVELSSTKDGDLLSGTGKDNANNSDGTSESEGGDNGDGGNGDGGNGDGGNGDGGNGDGGNGDGGNGDGGNGDGGNGDGGNGDGGNGDGGNGDGGNGDGGNGDGGNGDGGNNGEGSDDGGDNHGDPQSAPVPPATESISTDKKLLSVYDEYRVALFGN